MHPWFTSANSGPDQARRPTLLGSTSRAAAHPNDSYYGLVIRGLPRFTIGQADL